MKQSERLLQKYISGEADPHEQAIIDKWYADLNVSDTSGLNEAQKRIQLELIRENLLKSEVRVVKLWPRIAIAAAITALVLGIYLFNFNTSTSTLDTSLIVGDIVPGTVGATLTLGNGKRIRLSDAADGEIAREAGISVTKSQDGQLIYERNEPKTTGKYANAINTLMTAKGETYILTLPDRSKVWMNAASSLTYSTNLLKDGKRSVMLDGEAYFQVAPDKTHPFVVKSRGQTIEVLGTHFNVNAYLDEPLVKTTLLEGKIKVSAATDQKVLSPGQQARFSQGMFNVGLADIEEVVSWKNGDIILNGQDVRTIMRMISRWYNVEVVYEGEVPKELYYAKISRSDNINILLQALERAQGIHFKIEGRRVIVTK